MNTHEPTRQATLSRALILLAACLAIPAALFAESSTAPKARPAVDVLIAPRSLDSPANAGLLEIIGLAASLELDRRGLSSLVDQPLEAAALREPGALLEGSGADYLLLAEFSERGKDLQLSLSWFDGASRGWIAALKKSGPEDMLMDEMIFHAIGELMDRVGTETQIIPKSSIVKAAGQAEAPAESSPPSLVEAQPSVNETQPSVNETQPSVNETLPSVNETLPSVNETLPSVNETLPSVNEAQPSVNEAQPSVSDTLPSVNETLPSVNESLPSEESKPPEAVEALPPIEEARVQGPLGPGGLELGFGAAPFLSLGSLGDFFKTAGAAAFGFSWYFPGRSLAAGLGLRAGALLFQAAGPLESAWGVLAPLALELRLVARTEEGQLRPYAKILVGAAYLNLQTNIYGTKSAILPFAGLGLGLDRMFGPGFGLSIDLSYVAYLDGKDLIMGLEPGVEIGIPLGKKR
jgi:hypothetical protein